MSQEDVDRVQEFRRCIECYLCLLIDEAALLAAVKSGHLHGSGLDTFEVEPPPSDSPLLSEPRIVLSPHAAAMTETSLVAMSVMTAKNALAGLDGTLDPELVVNPSVLKAK
jgi:D-3-phosphoglycerate dehydrogenase / 2-oxoglutarate reductase